MGSRERHFPESFTRQLAEVEAVLFTFCTKSGLWPRDTETLLELVREWICVGSWEDAHMQKMAAAMSAVAPPMPDGATLEEWVRGPDLPIAGSPEAAERVCDAWVLKAALAVVRNPEEAMRAAWEMLQIHYEDFGEFALARLSAHPHRAVLISGLMSFIEKYPFAIVAMNTQSADDLAKREFQLN